MLMFFKVVLNFILIAIIIYCAIKIFTITSLKIIHHNVLKEMKTKSNTIPFNSFNEFNDIIKENLEKYSDDECLWRMISGNKNKETIEFFKNRNEMDNDQSEFKISYTSIIVNNKEYYFKNFNDYYSFFEITSTIIDNIKNGKIKSWIE